MKAVVFRGIGEIGIEDVPEPIIEEETDAIVRITTSAICGTDLHLVRGTFPGIEPGTIIGHEGVGIVEDLGPGVRNLVVGDRVVIPSTIACGSCSYCRKGYYAQCDHANPNGKRAGTAFFGGPKLSGGFAGLQAEKARVPFAHVGLVKLPASVSDEQAIMLSDIFPTGYFGADLAHVHPGASVAVFGCGPVGQFVIASLKLMNAGRIFAVDCLPTRLEMARAQGAEVINFDQEDPVEVITDLTYGIGVDRAIDAVGVDSVHPHAGPALDKIKEKVGQLEMERDEIAPQARPDGRNWHPGDAPSQAVTWAIDALAKAGTLAIIGVYPETDRFFPLGQAMLKNITVRAGNCHHRKYIPKLVELVQSNVVDPTSVLTEEEPLVDAVEAFKAFDRREPAWIKVALRPQATAGTAGGI